MAFFLRSVDLFGLVVAVVVAIGKLYYNACIYYLIWLENMNFFLEN